MPGRKTSASLALVDEDGGLALADGELGPHLDLVVVAREAVGEDVVLRRLGPLDDVDELAADFVPKAHGDLLEV